MASWPIIASLEAARVIRAADGVIWIRGVALTEAHGWMKINRPDDAPVELPRNPAEIRVRLDWMNSAAPPTVLEVAGIEIGPRHFSSPFALVHTEYEPWLYCLEPAIRGSIHDLLSRKERRTGSGARPAIRVKVDPRTKR